jgi:hypothetical protein
VYSRNVWDMKAFGNKIYFGHGDWGDNTGPIPFRYFDTISRQFLTDFVLHASNTACQTADGRNTCADDEALENFRIIDNKLYTTGVDAREPSGEWLFGNFYTRDATGSAWVKYRTIPGGVHVFDVYKFPDPLAPSSPAKLFAGIGTDGSTVSPQVSDDDGQTAAGWRGSTLNGGQGQTQRIHHLFSLAGRLYASGTSFSPTGHLLLRYEGGVNFSQIPISTANRLFPDKVDGSGNSSVPLRVFRELQVGNQMVYLGTSGDQPIPFGLYRASDILQAQTITLPVASIKPMDLLLGAEGTVYVVGQTGAAGSYTNYVFSSTDLNNWTEVLRFASTTFVRSFEYLGGRFYFGLGTTRAELSSAAGDILEVACPLGDVNCDYIVDVRDYGVWRLSFGAGTCGNAADLTGDCTVDIRDYGLWRQHFGETAAAPRSPGAGASPPR